MDGRCGKNTGLIKFETEKYITNTEYTEKMGELTNIFRAELTQRNNRIRRHMQSTKEKDTISLSKGTDDEAELTFCRFRIELAQREISTKQLKLNTEENANISSSKGTNVEAELTFYRFRAELAQQAHDHIIVPKKSTV
jgi:hypothetical protein